jgi:hypothetical protein
MTMASTTRTLRGLALALCMLPLLARAGIVIETVEFDSRTGKSKPLQKMYLQGGMARMEDADGDVSLLKGDAMIEIDKAERSYRVMDKAAMQQLSAAMERMRAQSAARMAKMPPAQRAQMEKAMPARAAAKPPVYEAVDTGRSQSVDGRSCRVWNLRTNGVVDEELCVVPYSMLPGKENVQQVMRTMAGFMQSMEQAIGTKGGGDGYLRAFLAINGFPLVQRDVVDGKPAPQEDRMKSWQEVAIPPALFEVPAGYRRVDPASDMGDDDDK